MLFDRLCGIVEAHIPEMIPILRKAKIFEFPVVPHEFLPKVFSEDIEWFEENFFLPFPVVAIEDKASCMILFDMHKGQKGMYEKRGFIECMSLNADNSAFRESQNPFDPRNSMDFTASKLLHEQGFAVVEAGFIEKMHFESPKKFLGEGGLSKTWIASKREIKMEDFHNDWADLGHANIDGPITNAYAAIQEIYYFNQPELFVLEESPIKPRKKSKKRQKLLRSFERPKYTMLKPREIRKQIGLPEPRGTHASPIPHERRRHVRWLSDPIYSKDENGEPIEPKTIPFGPRKGQIYYKHVDVPAVWIGQSENKKGHKHYRVLVNK